MGMDTTNSSVERAAASLRKSHVPMTFLYHY
jgi:hypothetical protein